MVFKHCITYQNWDNNLVDVSLTKAIKSQKNGSLYNCSQDGDKDDDAYVRISFISFKYRRKFFKIDISEE